MRQPPHQRSIVVGALLGALLLALAPAMVRAAAGPPDSTRLQSAPRWMQLAIVGGMGGMTAPARRRRQYEPGLEGGLELRLLATPWLRGTAALAYQDLPALNQIDQLSNLISGSSNTVSIGGGNQLSLLAGIETRAWGPFFIGAYGGAGHFGSSDEYVFPEFVSGVGDTLADPFTDPGVRVRSRSGWGATWGFGAGYEFQPTPRDRFALEATFSTMRARGGDLLRYLAIGVGYRLY